MSYILDALRKSEQERGHGSAPGVQTLHTADLNYRSSKTQLWPYFLLGAVIINLAALVYFIVGNSGEQTAGHEQAMSMLAHTADNDIARGREQGRPAASTPRLGDADTIVYKPVSMPGVGQPAAKPAPMPRVSQADAEPAPSVLYAETAILQPPAEPVIEMGELPMDVLQHIPVIEVSAHVYSTNPLQRSIVINGRFMEEGDRLTSDLYLSEITRDGAIFDYQGQRFHQRVVSTWN